MKTNEKSERGQILILLVIVLVALLGFTALAIDGGMMFSNRRFSQNAADAASMAGGGAAAMKLENYSGGFSCSATAVSQAMSDAETAAIANATVNGYTITSGTGENTVKATCIPAEEAIDVRVTITQDTDSSFAHLFFSGPLRGTVETVTRVEAGVPFANGNAFVSLGQESCSGNKYGMQISGGSTTEVHGGGAHSNSCLDGDGNTTLFIYDAGISLANSAVTGFKSGHILPATQTGNAPILQIPQIDPPPACVGASGGSAIDVKNNDTETINPGNFTSIQVKPGGTLIMNPGVYCITGGSKGGGGGLLLKGDVTGDNVNIYVMEGDVQITAGGVVKLNAPLGPYDYPWQSMVIFMADENTSDIEMEGHGSAEFGGTVFGRNNEIKFTGSSGVGETYSTQIIGRTIRVGGNADLSFTYDENRVYDNPTTIALYQ